jgi:NACHT domain
LAKDTTINTGTIYNVSQTEPTPEIAILDYVKLFDRQLASISDQFVPLSVIVDIPFPTMEVIPAHVFLRHDRAFEGPEKESLAENLAMSGRSIRLSDAVDQQDAVVIRGDPGSGKSVSCEYLAQRVCRGIIKDGWHAKASLLPVLISMHRFATVGYEAPSDALARLVAYTLRQAGALPAGIESLSRHGRVYLEQARNESLPLLLCLDGLNEVAAGTVRDAAYDAINQLVTSLRGTRSKIVVTTRRYGFEAFRLGSLKIFDVQPLTEVQIKDYLARRVGIGPSEAATLFTQLPDKIRQHASNPLHLNLVARFNQFERI